MGIETHILFAPDSEGGLPPANAFTPLDGRTYGDVRPMLAGSEQQMELGLVRIAQIARGNGEMNAQQLEDAVSVCTGLLDHEAGTAAHSPAVRMQALLTLEALGQTALPRMAIPEVLRDRTFSLLATLSTERAVRPGEPLVSSIAPLRESDPQIRALSTQAAGYFRPIRPA